MTTAQIDRPPTNRTPQAGDQVRTYDYKRHEHREVLVEEVSSNEGPAVGGGYYIYMKSGPVVSVEQYPEQFKGKFVWWEKHPKVTPNV